MEYRHELINFPANLPMKFFLHKIGDVPMHWHRSLELLYVAEGNVQVMVGTQSYNLGVGGLILINMNTPHRLKSDAAVLLAVQFKSELLTYVPPNSPRIFDCVCTSEDADDGKFFPLKETLAKILLYNLERRQNMVLLNTSLCYKLVYELFCGFAVPEKKVSTFKPDEELINVLTHINTNYSRELNLTNLAEMMHFAVPYFCKFFKQHIGITVGEYIRTVRLNHATEQLATTSDPIEKVAEENGFPNTRAFSDAFKKIHRITPGEWRNSNKAGQNSLYTLDQLTGYSNTDTNILASSISEFIKKYSPHEVSTNTKPAATPQEYIYADCLQQGKMFFRRNLYFIGISHIHELLFDDIRRELTEAQKQIGFKLVKMHGVFDDCMMVYNQSNGKPLYNFDFIDKAYDFLLSLGLKPLVQLSFMPSLLAKNPNKTTFYYKTITSPPSDIKKWHALVKEFCLHLINRYGENEVSSWMFTVWNEPNSWLKLFGFESENDFLQLYKSSYTAIKSVNKKFRVGGPSALCLYGKNNDWIFRFLKFCTANECLPDFADIHYYDVDLSFSALNSDESARATLSPTTSTYRAFIRNMKAAMNDSGFGNIPITVTEWNSTSSHRDPLSDTCFKSCYIVKNQLETLDEVYAGYWLLSDFHGEIPLNSKTFHGGLGMFTTNGIKKPAYYAYLFLSKLKPIIIERGDGYIVTRDGFKNVTILCYNYYHYSEIYAQEAGINTSYTDRYSVFPDNSEKTLSFELKMSGKGEFILTESYVNRTHGSVFDEFVRMGAVEPLTQNDVSYLAKASAPGLKKRVLKSNEDKLIFSATLEPFEIRLIEISEIQKN